MLLGHFSKDRLVVDDEVEICPGGSIYYGSIPLRHLGLSVAVVTRLHPDDFSFLDELRAEGVQVFGRPAPATSSVANIYRSADMERRICKLQSFAGPFQKADFPDLTAQVYLVVPIIAGEVRITVIFTTSSCTSMSRISPNETTSSPISKSITSRSAARILSASLCMLSPQI